MPFFFKVWVLEILGFYQSFELMLVPFWVRLDQVFLDGHLFYHGCLLLFAVCIFYDDVSNQIGQGKLFMFMF